MKFNTSLYTILVATPSILLAEDWKVQSQGDWEAAKAKLENMEIKDGAVKPTANSATLTSILKSFSEKRSAKSITLNQSTNWLNWTPTKNLGPKNCGGAPVLLKKGPQDYWILGTARKPMSPLEGKNTTLPEGYDIPLVATSDPNQFLAPGGLKGNTGGYHAWQTRDMVTWVYHGPVTSKKGNWVTTAEFKDGKAYVYYDFPNDQDPHLVIDSDLTDGIVGEDKGMAFKDPSDGSDAGIIRDLEGNFHLIYEDWSPINASKRAWDSPLAGHSVSVDGQNNFKILDPAVDERTKPTGKFGNYFHPHWYKSDPANYPGIEVPDDSFGHGIKIGMKAAQAKYEIHEPAQPAYGDWAAIAVGGQYYLFCDYDPVGAKSKSDMSVAWFTSSSINEQFSLCGNIGSGHPDPDIMFAEGQFYLITQNSTDFISPGPWVDGVEVRVGVDTDDNKAIDQWTDWSIVKETYDHIEGFSKQVSKTPAMLDLSSLPEGFGFQYEIRITDKTENDVTPVLEEVTLSFGE